MLDEITVESVVEDKAASTAAKVAGKVAESVAQATESAVESGIAAGVETAIEVIQSNEEQITWQTQTTEQLNSLTLALAELSSTLRSISQAAPIVAIPGATAIPTATPPLQAAELGAVLPEAELEIPLVDALSALPISPPLEVAPAVAKRERPVKRWL